MSIRVVERAVEAVDGGGQVGVRTELFGNDVIVKWFCGDTRTFTPDEIDNVVRCLDVMESFPDVWFQHQDSRSRVFFARIVDGSLYADTSPGGDGERIDWKEMKKVLAKAVK